MEDFVFLGTELKYHVEITADGFSMDDDDFEIVLKGRCTTATFGKSDLVFDGSDYYLVFDTTPFGTGILHYKIVAHVPDGDFPDGFRTEVFEKRLTMIIE